MNNLKLINGQIATFSYTDYWHRPVYILESGTKVCCTELNGSNLHTMSKDGEPCFPLKDELQPAYEIEDDESHNLIESVVSVKAIENCLKKKSWNESLSLLNLIKDNPEFDKYMQKGSTLALREICSNHSGNPIFEGDLNSTGLKYTNALNSIDSCVHLIRCNYKESKSNLLTMNCDELWDVLCSLFGTENIKNETDRDELLAEAQRQVNKSYTDMN